MHELKPGGASIIVTEENKREYVKLYVNYRFMRGIEQQFMSLQKGMYLTASGCASCVWRSIQNYLL